MYKNCLRIASCNGAKCWALKKGERKLPTTEMICGKILKNGISTKTICEMTSVEKTEEFF